MGHTSDSGPVPGTSDAQMYERMKESVLRLGWPGVPWFYHLYFAQGLLRMSKCPHRQNWHENACSRPWIGRWSLVDPRGNKEGYWARGGGENTQLSDLTRARHLASPDPHRRQEWSLRLGIFLKLKWDVVYEAPGTWQCLWTVLFLFGLKTLIREPHA